MTTSLTEIKPVVSVVMITYNHEKYIAEAVEGALMQEVDFPIEFIIADDCSPDATFEIIQNFIDNHPKGHWIKYTRHKNNKGMMPNFIWALEQASGKYIALCEGDDYWTDPLKLQKQVDFLDANEDFSICFHPVEILENGQIHPDDLEKVADETTILDLAKGNYIHTPSVVFRSGLFESSNQIFKKAPVGDYLIHMLNAKHGEIKKLDQAMAVYRKHDAGLWSTKGQIEVYRKWVNQMKLMAPLFSDTPAVQHQLKTQQKNYQIMVNNQDKRILFWRRLKGFILYRLSFKWMKAKEINR